MTDKLDYYAALGVLVPGAILIGLIFVLFPSISSSFSGSVLSDTFAVVVLTAISIVSGHLIQAVASLVEPLLYWSWGGRPSDRALAGGLKGYLPEDSATRIKAKLTQAMGGTPSDPSVFLYAMQVTNSAKNERVSRFNAIYGYHRGLIVLLLFSAVLICISMLWGIATSWNPFQKAAPLLVISVLLVLLWYRTKQRAFYYVREVLGTAEVVINTPQSVEE